MHELALDCEIEKDIAALKAYRSGRYDFNIRIVEASQDKSENVLGMLRTDAMYQIAEWFYLLWGFRIKTADEFDGLIERHNEYVASLLDDPSKMKRMGLARDKLLNAIFDGETRPRVLKVWADEPGTIDQSSMARFLVALMSDETARKALVAAGKAGFLQRQPSVFRLTLVKSTGVMEKLYGKCLRDVRLSVQQHLSSSQRSIRADRLPKKLERANLAEAQGSSKPRSLKAK